MKKEEIIHELHNVVLEGRLDESAALAEKSVELKGRARDEKRRNNTGTT